MVGLLSGIEDLDVRARWVLMWSEMYECWCGVDARCVGDDRLEC